MRKTHKEFMEIVKLAVSLPEITKRALFNEHPSDLRAIKRRDALVGEPESEDKNG